MTDPVTLSAPVRTSLTDRPDEILKFAIDALARGDVALATLIDIRGGAARSLGSQVAVAADGQFCGFVSGGCVEAAVASEALQAMADGRDRLVKFGEGSPFFDIVLPCGGGITVAIHLIRDAEPVQQVLNLLSLRQAAALHYDPRNPRLQIGKAPVRSGWTDERFTTVYRPQTRILLSGQPTETEAVLRLAIASGYEALEIGSLDPFATVNGIDPYTAVTLLHHDLDAETDVLRKVLASEAFYIDALGSTRTHRRRVERLMALGISNPLIDKIKAPIGMFGPTRDANSLALSVLADVAAARLQTFG